jgi:hypothetical protein
MSPEEASQNAPRRRGRPPGSKNRTRRKRAEGGELVTRLNAMVAQLISENRTLRRQVAKLAIKGKGTASKTVEKGLRTISRRVERALGTQKPRRRPAPAPANGRRRKATTRRRRAAS